MAKERPLLLLSNDDGFNAKGIRELIKALRPVADLVVVAPDGPRSGSSGAITSVQPLQYSLIQQEPGLFIYKCTGTPVDCIKLALFDIVTRVPSMVIGGINHGDNSSVNVHYSGTMGVVIEGCLKGIPSVGFSLCNHAADADFSPVLPYVRSIVEKVLEKGLPNGTCLNVNFPDTAEIKGVRVCRQTNGVWINEFVKTENPRGGYSFWLTGDYCNLEVGAEATDHWALDNGYVAITPTKVDVTDYKLMEELKTWNL
ncbi:MULTISPECIES: 5'/3'-nucleotidase SurE [unclassified Phocaeicola]|jgi:5'-nucleotidase|uniref:5'/3'-nucleotidase SurE n=1 Tax=unclassified Phocaeicola TaxID=2762211 RepID=UPI0015B76D00